MTTIQGGRYVGDYYSCPYCGGRRVYTRRGPQRWSRDQLACKDPRCLYVGPRHVFPRRDLAKSRRGHVW